MSMSGDVSMATLVEGLGKLGTTFWEYGRAFLWGCAGAALLVFAVLYGAKYFGFPNAGEVFATIGLWVLIAFAIFTALATARTLEGREKKTLFFVSNEEIASQCKIRMIKPSSMRQIQPSAITLLLRRLRSSALPCSYASASISARPRL
jgi:hypothetical protein